MPIRVWFSCRCTNSMIIRIAAAMAAANGMLFSRLPVCTTCAVVVEAVVCVCVVWVLDCVAVEAVDVPAVTDPVDVDVWVLLLEDEDVPEVVDVVGFGVVVVTLEEVPVPLPTRSRDPAA